MVGDADIGRSTVAIGMASLLEAALIRGAGYAEAVIEAGTVADDVVFLPEKDWLSIRARFAIRPPTIRKQFANFMRAMRAWHSAGFPVVSRATFGVRFSACKACEYWHAEDLLKFGRCRHEKCGCSCLKLWLSTEACPLGHFYPFQFKILPISHD